MWTGTEWILAVHLNSADEPDSHVCCLNTLPYLLTTPTILAMSCYSSDAPIAIPLVLF